MNGRDILKRFGATDIESYTLISNYGYKFKLNGEQCDIRFWANCYGCYIGKWDGASKEINKAFNDEIGDSHKW